jgi:hypothetical protein
VNVGISHFLPLLTWIGLEWWWGRTAAAAAGREEAVVAGGGLRAPPKSRRFAARDAATAAGRRNMPDRRRKPSARDRPLRALGTVHLLPPVGEEAPARPDADPRCGQGSHRRRPLFRMG